MKPLQINNKADSEECIEQREEIKKSIGKHDFIKTVCIVTTGSYNRQWT